MSRRAGALLWMLQGPLAVMFLFAGATKLAAPLATLSHQTPVPALVLRAVGVLEVLGAAGLLLPGLMKRRQLLTPLAAAGLLLVMAGATGVTLASGDARSVVAPVIAGTLLLVVLVGRLWMAPRGEVGPDHEARAPV